MRSATKLSTVGFGSRLTTPAQVVWKSLVSEGRTKSSKRSSAPSLYKRSGRKKIREARERMSTINAPKAALARELGVSRAALYYRPRKPARDEALKQKIVAIMDDHPAYGQRRVAMARGRNKKPIRRVMRLFRLKPRILRGQRPVKPDDQNRSETRVVNILKTLCPIRANIVWAGDFTYLWFIDRFWYVATVIDLWTREIIGWHVANHHTDRKSVVLGKGVDWGGCRIIKKKKKE